MAAGCGFSGRRLRVMLIFWRHEGRASSPMIDLEMLRGKSFAAANWFSFLSGVLLAGFIILLPLYAVSVYGASTLESGLMVTPRAAAVTVASVVTSFMLVRWGYRRPMIAGVMLISIASVVLALELQSIALGGIVLGGTGVMLFLVALSGIGFGLTQPASNNAYVDLRPDRVSTVVGLAQTVRSVGVSLGVAIGTMVLHNAPGLPRGFQFLFFGMAAVALISVPFILGMPRSPSVPRSPAQPQ